MNSKLNKISIITPSYNQGIYLEETILSVLNQNYPDVELIIIDGGSKDNSLEIIQKYSSGLSYWVSEPDSGQSEAINKGFDKATGDILMWLNSDDVLLEGSLSKINELFNQNPDIDIIHGQSLLFGDDIKNQIIGKDDVDLEYKYLAYIPFPQPASFLRRKVLNNLLRVNTSLHYGMDFDLYVRAYLQGFQFMKVDYLFSKYRIHKSSKSNDDLKFAADWAKIFSSVARSLKGNEEIIKILKDAELYTFDNSTYDVTQKLSAEHLKKSLLYHLYIQAHYNYSALELVRAFKLCKIIERTDPLFYRDMKLSALSFRSLYFPKSLISFLRKLTRN
ncbi:glycosyltransferase family 2 protein [Sporocytophaga myxococcoides]|uniref:glycosyltransferase family 2 protein n=1 Tax=Sporocytophaga myxococcoides TaxID=153721 RepID=UPI0004201691|nr:glycosyltransferase family 2 protein [Sporocytophaga myxococcoides]